MKLNLAYGLKKMWILYVSYYYLYPSPLFSSWVQRFPSPSKPLRSSWVGVTGGQEWGLGDYWSTSSLEPGEQREAPSTTWWKTVALTHNNTQTTNGENKLIVLTRLGLNEVLILISTSEIRGPSLCLTSVCNKVPDSANPTLKVLKHKCCIIYYFKPGFKLSVKIYIFTLNQKCLHWNTVWQGSHHLFTQRCTTGLPQPGLPPFSQFQRREQRDGHFNQTYSIPTCSTSALRPQTSTHFVGIF